MYDWANSAFATTIMAAMFPPFFRSLAVNAGLAESTATAFWAYTTSIALLTVSLLAPVLGAVSDHTGGRKRYLAFFAGMGIVATALFALLGDTSYVWASVLFIIADFGFAGANIFYESLLPHISRPGDMDRISTRGYALGYLGGGILLVINALWFMKPEWFFMPNAGFALRASFFSVAVWWAVFTIPVLRNVPEPDAVRVRGEHGSIAAAGFHRLVRTFREVRRYRQLLVFLVAFWLYNDGIGTIIKMATAYGDEIGIGMSDMVIALIITQFGASPSPSSSAAWLGASALSRGILLAPRRLRPHLHRRLLHADGPALLPARLHGGIWSRAAPRLSAALTGHGAHNPRQPSSSASALLRLPASPPAALSAWLVRSLAAAASASSRLSSSSSSAASSLLGWTPPRVSAWPKRKTPASSPRPLPEPASRLLTPRSGPGTKPRARHLCSLSLRDPASLR